MACGRRRVDLGRVAMLPALVNAHTHLELSYLHGRVPPAPSFIDWVTPLMALRRQLSGPERATRSSTRPRQAIARARATGTGLVGDVSNTLVTVPLLREAGMPAQVFHELIGFRHRRSGRRGCVRPARRPMRLASTARRPRQPRPARAVFGVAGAVHGDSRRRRRASRSGHERAPRRVGGGSASCSAAAAVRCASMLERARRVADEWQAAGGVAGRNTCGARLPRSAACWSCTACSSTATISPARDARRRRWCRARAATLCRRRRAAARGVLRRWTSPWRSAPTAWPASPT